MSNSKQLLLKYPVLHVGVTGLSVGDGVGGVGGSVSGDEGQAG